MSLKGKNRKLFSYINEDKSSANFDKKDFDKTSSYHTNFSNCSFSSTSLRGAKMKFCSFRNAIFEKTEFVGAILKGSNFEGAVFNRAIFNATNIERANFSNAVFKNVIFINTNISKAKNLSLDKSCVSIYNVPPSYDNFSRELISIVDELKTNEFIRKSHILHLKKNRINTIYLDLLVKEFSEETLIEFLPKVSECISKPFYTLSYIECILTKLCKSDKI